METEKKEQFRKFTQGYTFKILLLIFLVLILLIPLAMIRGLISERNRTSNEAETGIMEAWGSELVTAGPVIAVPGIRTEEIRIKEKDVEKIEIIRKPFTLIITPEKLNIAADFKTEIRRRGIFSVPLFYGEFSLSGSFNPGQALSSLLPNEKVSLNQAELIITLSSQKGIRKINKAEWNVAAGDGKGDKTATLFFQPGNQGQELLRWIQSTRSEYLYYNQSNSSIGGIFAALPDFTSGESNFDISINIQGGRLVRILPVGLDTHTSISADWPSPSFQGSFLPGNSEIGDDGFNAAWDINYLSRDIPLHWKNEGVEIKRDYSAYLFGVNFFRAIDTYSLNTRAVKYAILFLIVPFLTLFLLEVFTKKRIHPVPYLLSGIANIIFYLLLLSLSEQMQFYLAYLIAALAVMALLTLYSRSLLPSWKKSSYMGLVVTTSYVLLYAVLNAESYALLIGSIGAFVVVALVMFLTRKLNWYNSDE
jgi:inner membrane protein